MVRSQLAPPLAALLCAALLLVLVSFARWNGSISRAIGRSRAGPMIWDAISGAARMLPGDYASRASDYLEAHRPANQRQNSSETPFPGE